MYFLLQNEHFEFDNKHRIQKFILYSKTGFKR